MVISPDTPSSSLPMLRRLAYFENLVCGPLDQNELLAQALNLWSGVPLITIFPGTATMPASVLLRYPNATMWFAAGANSVTIGWQVVSGYDYSAGRIPESEDDNLYFGYQLWNWWNNNIRDLFFANPGPRVIVGHSTGGAWCHDLVWRRLNRGLETPTYVTFGAPRAFGLRACQLMEQNRNGFRYMLPADPVPRIWPRNFEFPEAVFTNPSAVAWQHPLTDGMVLQGDSFVAAVDPPQIGTFPTLDIGSWMYNMTDNPNHSMSAYSTVIRRITQQAEDALVVGPPAPIDPQLAPEWHDRVRGEPQLQSAITVTEARQAQAARAQFVAQNSPPIKIIKLFTWRRRGRKYEVLCNGHVIAWGFRRHSAAECARAGNDLIYRMIAQSLVVDPQSMEDALHEFWESAIGLGLDLKPLITELRAPLAIY